MVNKFFRYSTKETLKRRTKYVIITTVFITVINYFGILHHLFEKDFDSNFDYPLNVDIIPLIDQLRNNKIPSISPINMYNYSFSKTCEEKCKDLTSLGLVIIVKSALDNFERRQVIRNTYGDENRFPDINIRTVFLLGIKDFSNEYNVQQSIDEESKTFRDIVQANFIDSYFNNTIKTMMGLTWVSKYCPYSKFYYFSDDDMYVSTKNLIHFIKNSSHYPEYIKKNVPNNNNFENYNKKQLINNQKLPDNVVLYSGFSLLIFIFLYTSY